MDNYLAEVVAMGEMDRGITEFFRELPGIALIFILAAFYMLSAETMYKAGAVIMLVGMSMPNISASAQAAGGSIMAAQPMLPWGTIALHVLAVSVLSNVGKLVPMLFYRNHSIKERLALSIGMFTRGEVGAGVIFIALGYNIGGPALLISVLTLVLNLVLTGGFVLVVKRLALNTYKD